MLFLFCFAYLRACSAVYFFLFLCLFHFSLLLFVWFFLCLFWFFSVCFIWFVCILLFSFLLIVCFFPLFLFICLLFLSVFACLFVCLFPFFVHFALWFYRCFFIFYFFYFAYFVLFVFLLVVLCFFYAFFVFVFNCYYCFACFPLVTGFTTKFSTLMHNFTARRTLSKSCLSAEFRFSCFVLPASVPMISERMQEICVQENFPAKSFCNWSKNISQDITIYIRYLTRIL